MRPIRRQSRNMRQLMKTTRFIGIWTHFPLTHTLHLFYRSISTRICRKCPHVACSLTTNRQVTIGDDDLSINIAVCYTYICIIQKYLQSSERFAEFAYAVARSDMWTIPPPLLAYQSSVVERIDARPHHRPLPARSAEESSLYIFRALGRHLRWMSDRLI